MGFKIGEVSPNHVDPIPTFLSYGPDHVGLVKSN